MSKIELARNILNVIEGYQNDDDIQLTEQSILNWSAQFEENDQEFILSELLHLLNKNTYLSKASASSLIIDFIEFATKRFKYPKPESFLLETKWLYLQKEHSSQDELLKLTKETILHKWNIQLDDCGKDQVKNYLYFDDILATGKSLAADINCFFETDIQAKDQILTGQRRLLCFVFCCHSWGRNNAEWVLMKKYGNAIKQTLHVFAWFKVENNVKDFGQKLNLVFPLKQDSPAAEAFLNSLEADRYADRAFRPINLPAVESFFSSPENRIRFEHIILAKGLLIMSRIANLRAKGLRPLGYTASGHKTLGLGTIFFTWRNISNTCPLVFWWNNPAHEWVGLFPVKNRGQQE